MEFNLGDLKFIDYTESKYKEISPFNNGLARVLNKQKKYGYINTDGIEVIPCIYDEASDFNNGIACVSIKSVYTKKLTLYINTKGETIIDASKYINARNFSEGLAAVKNSKGNWGYININGEEVLPCQLKEVSNFSNGIALVDTSNKYEYPIISAIDKEGKIINQLNKNTKFKEEY